MGCVILLLVPIEMDTKHLLCPVTDIKLEFPGYLRSGKIDSVFFYFSFPLF